MNTTTKHIICALEGCYKKVGSNPFEFSFEVDRWLIKKPGTKPKYQCFCSNKCLEGYYDWAVWQKDMGNEIESYPPDYGGQVKDLEGNV